MSDVKAIFITGAASGIGRAVAGLFSARGWRTGLADVDAEGLKHIAATLPDGMAQTYVMDVRDRDAWNGALRNFVEQSGGRLDVLHNNAGIAVGGPFGAMSADDMDRVIAINFAGVLKGAHAAYPYLRRTPGSCLLNTCSASGIYGSAGLAAYSATKFGVRGLSEALDGEWAKDGIKVRVLMPGFIETPLLNTTVAGSNRSVREGVVDMGLEITPVEDVAEAAWRAVHAGQLHWPVGKTAKRMTFLSRWAPGMLRRQMRRPR